MKKTVLFLIACLMFSVGYAQKISKKLKEKYQKVELLEEYGKTLYRVLDNNKYGLFNEKGNEILSCKYDWLYISAADLTNPKDEDIYVGVTINGKTAIYDLQGKEIFPFIYETAFWNLEEETNTYYMSVENNGKRGICLMDGTEVIPCNYDSAYLMYERDSNTLYVITENNGKRGICLMDGTEVIPCNYKSAYLRYEKDSKTYYISVKNNGKYGACLMNGKEVIPCVHEEVHLSSTMNEEESVPYFTIINNDLWGISNMDGEMLVPCKYDQVRLEYIKETNFYYAHLTKEGKYGICTLDGKEIVPCICEYVEVIREEHNGLLYIIKKINDKQGIVNINGDEIIPCKYGYVHMGYDEEAKSNYYFTITISDNLYSSKEFNLSGKLIGEKNIKMQPNTSSTAYQQNNGLSKLEKTTLILQALAQGMQAMNGYMNTYSSSNIYSGQSSGSSSTQKTCSFCNGTGYNPGLERPPFYSSYDDPMTNRCSVCNDKSNHYHKQCPACMGRGYR